MVQKLSENAMIPTRGSPGAAGYDLYSPFDLMLRPGNMYSMPVRIAVAIPPNYYGRILSRSSMAKNGIEVEAGVIDSDYRGEIYVLLHNIGQEDYIIKKGDRMAQLIITRIVTPNITITDQLPHTERNKGGFGSTGV